MIRSANSIRRQLARLCQGLHCSTSSQRRNVRRMVRPAVVECLEQRQLLTLDIQIDYTYDTSGFLTDPARREILELVASIYEARITDDLDAIIPSGGNSWSAVFENPSTGVETSLSNPTIPADTVIVYVGARDLNSGLGLGGPGGFSSSGTAEWLETVETRGEPGVIRNSNANTDFAPWGGSLAFDNATNWNFSMDPPISGQNDFFSVTLHEMGHLLGFGTSESFSNLINFSRAIHRHVGGRQSRWTGSLVW